MLYFFIPIFPEMRNRPMSSWTSWSWISPPPTSLQKTWDERPQTYNLLYSEETQQNLEIHHCEDHLKLAYGRSNKENVMKINWNIEDKMKYKYWCMKTEDRLTRYWCMKTEDPLEPNQHTLMQTADFLLK